MPITEACKTTILSKRWKDIWTFTDNMIFGDDIIPTDDLNVNRFISLMDTALSLLSCSKRKKFHLYFYFDQFKDYRSKLDEWIGISVEKNVLDFQLVIALRYYDFEQYKLPQVLCSSSSLEKLECRNCSISEDYVIRWISLKSLTLKYLRLTDKAIVEIISGCPQLESLELHYFTGFQCLRMTSTQCKMLHLNGHMNPLDDRCYCPFEDCSLEVVAPYVQHLKISGNLKCMTIRLRDMSSLVHAELTFDYFDTHWKPNCEQLKDMVKHLLKSISCATELTIGSCFIEYCRFKEYWDEAIDSLGNNCLSLQENVLEGSLQNLKNAKIVSGFYQSFYRDDQTEISELVESWLKHAIVLEELIVALNRIQ